MDVIRVVNIIPNSHSNENNQDSEPSIAVDPSNPAEMVITAFTPPDAGVANGPLFFSIDGGETWQLNFDIPAGGPFDQSVAYASTSSELYGAFLRGDNVRLNATRTDDPTATATLPSFDSRANIDQPWAEAMSVSGGGDSGKDRFFIGYNDDSGSLGSATAKIDVCFDGLAGSPSFSQITLEPRTVGAGLRDGYAIRPAAHSDGTVYVVYEGWRSGSFGANITTDIVVARDNNGGHNNFGDLKDPSDNKIGRLVQTGVVINDGGFIGQERLNNDLTIAVDPSNSDIVYIAWSDDAGPNYTMRVRRSLNRGVDWSGDLLSIANATMACLAINTAGVVGLMYQQVNGANWETHFRRTTDGTGAAWSDVTLSIAPTNTPAKAFDPYLGDWARVVAVGRTFYGTFCANNTPDPANFPSGVVFLRNRTTVAPFQLLGNDGTTVVGVSIDPFFFRITDATTVVITDRSTFGKDEINAMLHISSPAVISAAFYVIVDGFRADELGITAATLGSNPNVVPTISFNPPLTAAPAGSSRTRATFCSVDGGTLISAPQRFIWTFAFNFFDDSDFTAEVRDITMTASITSTAGATVTGQAVITLTTQPNPYEIDGSTSWLSVDLQVFNLRLGRSLPSTPGISLTGSPTDFIHNLLANTGGGYNDPALARAPNHPFDLDLVANQDSSTVEISGTVGFPPLPVFDFAVARVRYRALLNPASNVRVFFRTFQVSTTSTEFQPATYPTGGLGATKIPLLGAVNGEIVTIPFFAAPRVSPANANGLNAQTDPDNVGPAGGTIPPDGSGAEVQVYFGCWLDINQNTNVLPADPATQTGPFAPAKSIQQTITGKHQCLVAEINMDPPAPQIAAGITPALSDKMAQRNLHIVGVASPHQVPVTFDIKPTSATGPTPDELMIDWGRIPAGTQASIFLPGLGADVVIRLANQLYTRHGLSAADPHTIRTKAEGITFVPIPPGVGSNYAGLLTIDLPPSVEQGQVFKVVVRQITNKSFEIPPIIEAPAVAAAGGNTIDWRAVRGTFQTSIPVLTRAALLEPEERLLSVMRFIAKTIPHTSRWDPVMDRYLRQTAKRVEALGGDPTLIGPTSSGAWYKPAEGHGALVITFVSPSGGPITDLADVFLKHFKLSDERVIRRHSTDHPLAVLDLISTNTGIYELQVLPDHHAAVGRFVTINEGEITEVTLTLKPGGKH